jgi:hypothetical protein
MGFRSLLLMLVLVGLTPMTLRADPPVDDTAPEELGPLVIDEVFLDAGNITSILQGIQWVEISNPSDEDVSLSGLWLEAGELLIDLDPMEVIEAGDYFVLVVTQALAAYSWSELPGAEGTEDVLPFPIQVVTGAALPESGALDLHGPLGLIDRVDLDAADDLLPLPGYAASLDPEHLSPIGNNEPDNWCLGLTKTSLMGHLVNGTPGDINPSCDNDADGFTEEDGDCDDHDAGISPDAPEACNAVDDDCNGLIDDLLLQGNGPSCQAQGICFGTLPSCVAGAWLCAYPTDYEDEESSCDGLDNDCDGLTDEGLTNACGLCGALQPELCDGLDNDCDGETDEELSPGDGLTCLSAGACEDAFAVCEGAAGWRCDYGPDYEPEETLCDGKDNDCDDQIDDGFFLGTPCSQDNGECSSSGTLVCAPDQRSVVCDAPPVGLSSELCGDGVDNDCNGVTDEGFPVGQTCEVGVGACRVIGAYACSSEGDRVVCDATPIKPGDEICDDGLDNDCDDELDELDCRLGDDPISQSGGTTDLGAEARGCGVGRSDGGRITLLLFGLILCGLGAQRRGSRAARSSR